MLNVNEFKAAMVRKGFTQKDVAERLDISTRTLSSRLQKGVFGSDEIEKLVAILEINDPMPIFFASKVT